MTTLSQLIKNPRRKKIRRTVSALEGNPQLAGVCIKTANRSPKKPNSANRKVAIVRLSNGRRITVAQKGEGSAGINQYSVILVAGTSIKDLIGVRYKMIRGTRDAAPVKDRKQGRSKYGTLRPK